MITRLQDSRVRTYTCDGAWVKSVSFYSDGQIHFSTQQGWIDAWNFQDGQPTGILDVVAVNIAATWVNKRDLFRTDCYYTGVEDSCFVHLFLYAKPIPVGEFLLTETPFVKHYQSFVKVPICCQIDNRIVEEIILCSGYRQEKTPRHAELEALEGQFKADSIDLYRYQLEKLLTLYTVTRKS